jgi:hypothetical protein
MANKHAGKQFSDMIGAHVLWLTNTSRIPMALGLFRHMLLCAVITNDPLPDFCVISGRQRGKMIFSCKEEKTERNMT